LKFSEFESISTKFVQLLEHSESTKDYSDAIGHLNEMGPSAVDFEIQSLPVTPGNTKHLRLMMEMLITQLDTNQDFEILQAYLNVLLKYHGDLIIESPELQPKLQKLKRKQQESWARLQTMFQNSLCLIRYFSGLQT